MRALGLVLFAVSGAVVGGEAGLLAGWPLVWPVLFAAAFAVFGWAILAAGDDDQWGAS